MRAKGDEFNSIIRLGEKRLYHVARHCEARKLINEGSVCSSEESEYPQFDIA